MKRVLTCGIMLDGCMVSIEKGKTCYVVQSSSTGSFTSIGNLKTLEEARKVYRSMVQDIRLGIEWGKENGI